MNNTFFDEFGNEKEDALNEQTLIQEFNNELETTNFHVYGLSGDWGTGKSAFIQMWMKQVKKENYSVIKIDAFKNDYIQNPFSMIYTAFKFFMKENKISKTDAKPIVEKAKKIAFASLKSAGQFGINLLIDKIGKDNVKDLVSNISDSLFDELNYEPEDKDENLCDELKELLTLMIKKSGKQFYIIIDELDRCRPDFALETLEKIKHLFAIEGVKFMLVYNPIVIANVVRNKYGIEDYNNRYIKKFIEKEIPFTPIKFYKDWLRSEAKELNNKGIDPNICKYIAGWADQISDIMVKYGLLLRDTERILTTIDNRNLFLDYDFNILFGATLAFYKAINLNEYKGLLDYLQKNGSFLSTEPPRPVYREIASHLMVINSSIDVDASFVEYFKNMKHYGNL